MIKRLTIRDVKKKCAECCCDYVDGRVDCEISDCALYSWMPYGKPQLRRREMKKSAPKGAIPKGFVKHLKTSATDVKNQLKTQI